MTKDNNIQYLDNNNIPLMEIDHIGIAVVDLESSIRWYSEKLGMKVVCKETNLYQGVREAMLTTNSTRKSNTKIQLLSSLNKSSTISRFIDKKGPGLQQIAYKTNNIELLSGHLRRSGVRLIYDTPKVGTENSSINFINPKDSGGVLIEIVQLNDF